MNGSDHLTAAATAFEAGQLLLGLRQEDEPARDGRPPPAEPADVSSNELILRRLADMSPGDAVLSEEADDVGDRRHAARVWIVDPLDGTREFGERARHDWAVHVALVEAGVLTAAAVALPARAMLFSTAARFPAPARPEGPPRIAVSRTRPPAEAAAIAEALAAELVPMGSAGAKAMAVILNEVDGYVHSGGQYEWDSAAPVGVALANGLHASRLDGSPLAWNQDHPWQPDLLICRGQLAPLILEVTRARGAMPGRS